MMNHAQELNLPAEIIGESSDCESMQHLLDPLPMDAIMSNSSSELLSGLMMDDIFSPAKDTTVHRQQRGRRVSFQEHPAEVNIVQSFACLDESERRGLWYLPGEIDHFRTNARSACRALRKNPFAYSQDATRGLELRTSLERQWRKHLTLTCIVKAQARYPHIDSFHLAEIAHDCTKAPRKEAIAQGKRDFCSVYYPIADLPLLLEEPIEVPVAKSSLVLEETPPPYHCLSRLQKRSSPAPPSYHYSEEVPHLAKRHCPMILDVGEQLQEISLY